MDLPEIDINNNLGYNPLFYDASTRRLAQSLERIYGQTGATGSQGTPGPSSTTGCFVHLRTHPRTGKGPTGVFRYTQRCTHPRTVHQLVFRETLGHKVARAFKEL